MLFYQTLMWGDKFELPDVSYSVQMFEIILSISLKEMKQ